MLIQFCSIVSVYSQIESGSKTNIIVRCRVSCKSYQGLSLVPRPIALWGAGLAANPIKDQIIMYIYIERERECVCVSTRYLASRYTYYWLQYMCWEYCPLTYM